MLHPPQNIIFLEVNVFIICSLSKIKVKIISSKKEQLINNAVKPKCSLNSVNRIVCKRLEVLFHLWNIGKKKVKLILFTC